MPVRELHYVIVAGFNYLQKNASSDIKGDMARNRLFQLFGEGEAYGGAARIGEHEIPGDFDIVVTLMIVRRRDKDAFPPYSGEDEPAQVLQTRFAWGDPRPDFDDESVWTPVPAFADRIGTRAEFYGNKRFKPENAPAETLRVVSITDLYLFLYALAVRRNQGAALRIMEVSIISHAWREGPILVNSYADSEAYPARRTPTDKDGRVRSDLWPPDPVRVFGGDKDPQVTMFADWDTLDEYEASRTPGEIAVPNLEGADKFALKPFTQGYRDLMDTETRAINHLTGLSGVFHSDARFIVWGCNAESMLRPLFQTLFEAMEEAGSDLEGVTVEDDTVTFPVTFAGDDMPRAYGVRGEEVTPKWLTAFLFTDRLEALGHDVRGTPQAELLDTINSRIQQKGVKSFSADLTMADVAVIAGVERSYAYNVARTFGVTCYAAAPGTWACYTRRRIDRKKPYPITEVPVAGQKYRGSKEGEVHEWKTDWIIDFYSERYEMAFDPETKFAIFDPKHRLFEKW